MVTRWAIVFKTRWTARPRVVQRVGLLGSAVVMDPKRSPYAALWEMEGVEVVTSDEEDALRWDGGLAVGCKRLTICRVVVV